ncbi:MAG: helix-turn-helix transcriptional regulator [Oscillospiraceae bacterium]|nr:helix-turn-helix transcriptional regulator [Oscillospiraceae bacterium]
MAEDTKVSFGLLGEGSTVSDTVEDFRIGYEEMKDIYHEQQREFPELEFDFRYDVASFLDHFSKIFSKSALESVTGIHQKQLGHYASGHRQPRPETVKRIETSLHSLAKELSQVQFNV